MGWVLLTNDDGVESPALVPFARALAALGDVRVVVPDGERSWSGKAITRFDPVRTRVVDRDGIEVLAHSGTPADGVQIASVAFDTAPSLVVSGINLGYNHGAGYLWSSGTVGAAVEGWVGGVPAIAVSTGTMHDWANWRREVRTPEAGGVWQRLSEVSVDIVGDLGADDAVRSADVWTINLPWTATMTTERRVTRIAQTGYDRLFARRGDDTYVHDFGGGLQHHAAVSGNDVDAAHDEVISITPLRMPRAEEIGPDLVARLER